MSVEIKSGCSKVFRLFARCQLEQEDKQNKRGTWWRRSLGWGGVFALSALLTTRVVLFGHEFIGHAGAAWLLGGQLRDHRLFLFGGGWVLTEIPGETVLAKRLLVSLGGVGLELVVAALCWWWGRRMKSRLWSLVVSIAASLSAIHIAVYIGLGTHYGYGDGAVLYHVLGSRRGWLIAPLCVGAVLGVFLLTQDLVARLGGTYPRRLVVVATLVGAGIHGGLMLAERTLRSDPTYAEIMRHESERRAKQLVARLEAERRRRGQQPMEAKEIAVIEQRERPWPLRPWLFVCMGVAGLGGLVTRRHSDSKGEPLVVDRHEYRTLLLATCGAIALVGLFSVPWWY